MVERDEAAERVVTSLSVVGRIECEWGEQWERATAYIYTRIRESDEKMKGESYQGHICEHTELNEMSNCSASISCVSGHHMSHRTSGSLTTHRSCAVPELPNPTSNLRWERDWELGAEDSK